MTTRLSRSAAWFRRTSVALAATAVASLPGAAQEASTFSLRGEVRDYVTERPIQGAVVQIAELGRSQVTDANGYFEFPEMPAGEHTFITASFGYETNQEPSAVGPGNIMLVHLNPMAVEIPGVSVEAERLLDQLETRRIMAASPATVFDQNQLAAGLPKNLTSVVVEQAPSMDLFTNENDQLCVGLPAMSQPIRLKVFLDEAPVPTAFLDNLQSTDVALLEVFDRLGMVRIYTHDFMQRAAEAGYTPTPINRTDRDTPC